MLITAQYFTSTSSNYLYNSSVESIKTSQGKLFPNEILASVASFSSHDHDSIHFQENGRVVAGRKELLRFYTLVALLQHRLNDTGLSPDLLIATNFAYTHYSVKPLVAL